MAEMAKRQRNDINGQYTSRGGPQLLGTVIEGDVYFNHANSGGQFTIFVEKFRYFLIINELYKHVRLFEREDLTDIVLQLQTRIAFLMFSNAAFDLWLTLKWAIDITILNALTQIHAIGLLLKEGSGILWIKGKPGSGKSTLMEFLLRDFEKQAHYQKSIQLSFFLHGRGNTLQKSRLGMFRSLLHQLLLRAPATGAAFQRSFEEKLYSQGEPGKDWD
ncbi:hypothetical protein BPAE_0001g00040 [Botrytis paeoniae]|uniref:Nephrocystin 3-like N-terminal domain-containing protein n=1 Tax=Botrytis paeoniae TaxID=278948 RepID=A0A4Z1G6L3_9HELO|nr:hypothetical protein BPAE_0001g00040 [Botrytis paeoniae]